MKVRRGKRRMKERKYPPCRHFQPRLEVRLPRREAGKWGEQEQQGKNRGLERRWCNAYMY